MMLLLLMFGVCVCVCGTLILYTVILKFGPPLCFSPKWAIHIRVGEIPDLIIVQPWSAIPILKIDCMKWTKKKGNLRSAEDSLPLKKKRIVETFNCKVISRYMRDRTPVYKLSLKVSPLLFLGPSLCPYNPSLCPWVPESVPESLNVCLKCP